MTDVQRKLVGFVLVVKWCAGILLAHTLPQVKTEFWDDTGECLSVGGAYYQGNMIRGETAEYRLLREFKISKRPIKAQLQDFAQGGTIVRSLNGSEVSTGDVLPQVHKGSNKWEMTYRGSAGTGGVIGELFLQYEDGTIDRINTDRRFICEERGRTNAVAIGPTPGTWRDTRILPYHDFAYGQKECIAGVDARYDVKAGACQNIYFSFEGPVPRCPIDIELFLAKDGHTYWRDEIVLSGEHIKDSGLGRWDLEIPFLAPKYLSESGEYVLDVSSRRFYCRGGTRLRPTVAITALGRDPDFAEKICAEVRTVAGVPQMFLNGRLFSPLWGATLNDGNPDGKPRFYGMPFNVVTVRRQQPEWNPKTGVYRFELLDEVAEKYSRECPTAYFVWDLSINPLPDWAASHPEDLCRDDLGHVNRDSWRVNYSFASSAAREVILKTIEDAIRHLEGSPYANRIIGYRINSGHTIEWLGWEPRHPRVLDYSPVGKAAFAAFSKKRYPGLYEPEVPALGERSMRDNCEDILWNVQDHLRAVAYNEFYSEAMVNNLIAACSRAKELVGGKKLIGTYYGYTMTIGSSGRSQHRAHYALKKLIDAHCVDFLMSPQDYDVRYLGDPVEDMKPFATLNKAGIMSLIEDDTRTCAGRWMPPGSDFGQVCNACQSRMVLRRNMSVYLSRLQPYYGYALALGTEFKIPGLSKDAADVHRVFKHCVNRGTRRKAEIAIVSSESSLVALPFRVPEQTFALVENGLEIFRYDRDGVPRTMSVQSPVMTGDTYRYNFLNYARIGAPSDFLLAEDLFDRPGDYKLYVFIGSFRYDQRFCEAVERLRRQGCALLWAYAPGYTAGSSSTVENMRNLTRVEFRRLPERMSAAVRMKDDGRTMGPEKGHYSPLFTPVAPEEVLGTYANGEPAVAAFHTGNALTFFCGTWQLDVRFLRSVARRAGVHVYSDSGDPMEANESVFTLHARSAAIKNVKLPRRTDVVDVFRKEVIARQAESFSFEADIHSSHLFYLGDDADDLIRQLKRQ